MRIFLTGASGFIGRHLLSLLGNHEVMCLSRMPSPGLSALPHVKVIQADLGQMATWASDMERFSPQCCVHLAWEGLPDYSDELCQRNLDTSLALIELLASCRAGRLVVSGSCWEYGAAAGAVAENSLPVNCGLFAATKHKLNMALESVARENGMAYRWARIFFAYGPGQRTTSLIPQCWAAFKAGRAPELRQPAVAQDFVHVDDVARGLLAMVECDMESGAYNLGSGTPTAVGAVANIIAQHFGVAPVYAGAGFDAGFWADTYKMAAATGWRARISLDDGIERTLQALEAA